MNRIKAEAATKKAVVVKEASARSESANAAALATYKKRQTEIKDQESKEVEAAYKSYKITVQQGAGIS
jgi:hypothetical protein